MEKQWSRSMARKSQQESTSTNTDNNRFCVVVNAEQQYSYWFADSPLPIGWESTGFVGTRAECLTEVDNIWTDMRPLSVRKNSLCKAIDTGVT
jgi:MbtH protein